MAVLGMFANVGAAQNATSIGKIGPRGFTGARGPAGTLAIGTVTVADPGTPASVTNVGTASEALWNIVIPRGSVIYSGAGTPSNTLGGNQDYYVNTTTSCFYGPKTSGAWPGSCLSMVGPTGATGATGATGPQGPAGTPAPSVNQQLSGDGAGGLLGMPEKETTVSSGTAVAACNEDIKAGIYDPRCSRYAGGVFGPTPWLAAQAMSNQMACDLYFGTVQNATAKWPQGSFAIDELTMAPGTSWEGSASSTAGTTFQSKYNNHWLAKIVDSMTMTCSDGLSHTWSRGGGHISHFTAHGCSQGGCVNAPGDSTNYDVGGPFNTGFEMSSTSGIIEYVNAFAFGGYGIRTDGVDSKSFHIAGGAQGGNLSWYYFGPYKGVTESAAGTEVSAVTTGTTSSVALSWPAVPSATGYVVYRGTTAGNETVFYLSATNSFTDTGAASTAYALSRLVVTNTLATPGTTTATPSATGGTLAAGTYYYRIVATTTDGWHGSFELVGQDNMADWAESYGMFDGPNVFTYHHLTDILIGGGGGHFDHLWPQLGQVGIAAPYGYGGNSRIEHARVDFARLEGIWITDINVWVNDSIVGGSCTSSNAQTINTGQERATFAGTCQQFHSTGVGTRLFDTTFVDFAGFGPTYKTADVLNESGDAVSRGTSATFQFIPSEGLLQGGGFWEPTTTLLKNVTRNQTYGWGDVRGLWQINLADTSPNTYWAFGNTQAGQDFYLLGGNSNVTLQNGGNLITCSGKDINMGTVKGYLHFMVYGQDAYGGYSPGSVKEICPSQPTPPIVASSETVAFSATPTFSVGTRASIMTLTGNVTNFTLAAGADGQEKTLTFCQNTTGGYTVTAPSNAVGFAQVSATPSYCSAQHFTYSTTQAKWVSDSSGTAASSSSNVLLQNTIISKTAPSKICASQAGISGSVACGGVVGVPVSIETSTGLATPVLNTQGVTNAVMKLGLTVNSSANTQALWPWTTSTSYDTSVAYKREQTFTDGSNLAGVDNYENDNYNFDHTDLWMLMFGWQCNRHNTGFWQYDNFRSGWHNTAVPCSMISGHTYHWVLTTHRDALTSTACTDPDGTAVPCLHWDTFQLDDYTAGTSNTYNINATYPAESVAYLNAHGGAYSTWQGVGAQVQIDVVDSAATSGSPQLVDMIIDNDNFSVYNTATGTYMPISGGTFTGAISAPTYNGALLNKDANGNVNMGGTPNVTGNTGTNNTQAGTGTFNALTTGSNNDAFGLNSLTADTTGYDNDAFGVGSLGATTTGHDNVAQGKSALGQNTTGIGNTAVGSFAGYNSGTPLQTLLDDTFFGDGANASADGLQNCTALGYNAQCTLSNQMVFGNSSVTQNKFYGDIVTPTINSAPVSRFGSSNNNIGGSMQSSSTGSNNTASGSGAMFSCTTCTSNSGFGLNALQAITTAGSDDAFGVGALAATTTGGTNTAAGHNALAQNTTGSGNTAVGPSAGYNSTTPMQTGTNNTFIGQGANSSADALTNQTAIGYNAQSTKSNQVMIGNSAVTEVCFAGGRMCWYSASGVPSTALCTSSNVGSLYSNTNGGATTTLYVCTAAATWTAK